MRKFTASASLLLLAALTARAQVVLDGSSRLERDCAARSARAGSFVVRAGSLLAPPDAALTASELGYCPRQENTP